MTLHDFYTDSVDFLLDDDFNAWYWGSYALLGLTGLLLLCTLFPPLMIAAAILILAQPLAYGLAWAFVGLVGLADLIFSPSDVERKAMDAAEGKSTQAEYFTEPVFKDTPADGAQPQPEYVYRERAAAFSNPLDAASYPPVQSEDNDFSDKVGVSA